MKSSIHCDSCLGVASIDVELADTENAQALRCPICGEDHARLTDGDFGSLRSVAVTRSVVGEAPET